MNITANQPTTKLKKPITFVRRFLKVKGPTEHSGRGYSECSADKTGEEMIKLIKNVLPTWIDQGIVEKVEQNDDDVVCIVLSKSKFEGDYRTFMFRKIFTNFFTNGWTADGN